MDHSPSARVGELVDEVVDEVGLDVVDAAADESPALACRKSTTTSAHSAPTSSSSARTAARATLGEVRSPLAIPAP
uniref:Uncharacterized protein n=1 Tax=Janibacter limosus TaxID=53458 RepID=A0AC61U6J3_9MICO|nr:hypothetical protein [Janibacter limosus]